MKERYPKMIASRQLRVLVLIFAAVLLPTIAAAATADFRILFDIDNNPATGCTQSGMTGVDQIMVLRVVTTESAANVTRSHRQVCTAGVFGAPVDEDLTPRPVS